MRGRPDRLTEREPAAAKPKPAAPTKALVTVVDGDTHRRLDGARVVIGRRADYANTRGLASVRLKRRTSLQVRVTKPGYIPRTVRMPFGQRRHVTVKLYNRALQWPMFGANARRTSAHTDIRLRPPFRVAWSRGIGYLVEFPAVISEGIAYVGNYKGHVYAAADARREGRLALPAVGLEDGVVAGDRRQEPHRPRHGRPRPRARQPQRGVRFTYRVGSPIESSPVVVDGVDYFGAWNGRVYALDLRRKRLRWTYPGGHKITSSAAIAGRTLYIGDYGGRLLALARNTGRLRFSRSVGGRVYGTPAVASGRVFVPSSTGGSLTAFTTGGRYLWRQSTGSYVYSSPAVWAGRVFFGSYNGRFYALSASSGRVLWSVGAGGPVSGAAVVVSGVAYAGSTWGRITGVDAKSGRVVLSFPHGEYVPVSGNGRRLLLHGYSRIWAVEPKR